MIEITVPGHCALRLTHLVLDLNGTILLDGSLLPGVEERLDVLRDHLQVHLISADTHGNLDTIAAYLGVEATRLAPDTSEVAQKASFVTELGEDCVVAIGNGANDDGMLARAAIGVAVVGREGAASATLAAADVVVCSIDDALDLLRFPRRLVATLRK